MDFNFNFKDLNTTKITALAGVSGCFVVGFGLMASATHYSGKDRQMINESYYWKKELYNSFLTIVSS